MASGGYKKTKADASNVYSKADIDDKLSTINQNLNTKVDAATVDVQTNLSASGLQVKEHLLFILKL